MLRNACAIHQNVNAAELADRRIHHGGDIAGNRHIRLQGNGTPSLFPHFFGRTLRILDIEIAGRDIAAEFRKASEIASPNPTPAPVINATCPLRSNTFRKALAQCP